MAPPFRSIINKIIKENPEETTFSLVKLRKLIKEKYPELNETSVKRWSKFACNKMVNEGILTQVRASYKVNKRAAKPLKRAAKREAAKPLKRVAKRDAKPVKAKRIPKPIAALPVSDFRAAHFDSTLFKDRVAQSTGIDSGLTEIVFAFDTTGSMSGAIQQVKQKIIETTERLFRDSPMMRISLIAHGDYCDGAKKALQHFDFVSAGEVDQLIKWINSGDLSTGGGDGEENYEMVLEYSAQNIKWTEGSRRVLVMIGDNSPHTPAITLAQMKQYGIPNPREIDWKVEADNCYNRGIKIYAVGVGYLNVFHQEIAARTCGTAFEMSGFESMADMVLALCFRETSGGMHYQTFLRKYKRKEG